MHCHNEEHKGQCLLYWVKNNCSSKGRTRANRIPLLDASLFIDGLAHDESNSTFRIDVVMRMKIVLLHSIIALAAGDNPRSGKDISVLPVPIHFSL